LVCLLTKDPDSIPKGPLTVREVIATESVIVKAVQHDAFAAELALFVKQGRSQVKRYRCLFTCLTTRVVHIEVARTLEVDSFICAYQRFVSRRGKPKEIHSDNGTNFTGAKQELREALERLEQPKATTVYG